MSVDRKRAFSLADVLIVLVVLALLLALLLRSADRLRRASDRAECAKNLRDIGQAMLVYASANRGSYPQTVYNADAALTQYTGSSADNPFGAGGPDANDVTAAMFLLIRTQGLKPEQFICPATALSSWDLGGKPAAAVSNFPGGEHLSYSIANPYPSTKSVSAGYKWITALGSEFRLAADMNPGTEALKTLSPDSTLDELQDGNSRNHEQEGQNVLCGDGHVEWHITPFCGYWKDCIYTVSGSTNPMDDNKKTSGTIMGSPAHRYDSVLLPVATVDPAAKPFLSSPMGKATWIGISVVAILWTAWWLTSRVHSNATAARYEEPTSWR
jgi:type II secretory pathway pseudopilin PulG